MNKGYGNVIKGLEMGDYTGLAEWALNASYKGPLSERQKETSDRRGKDNVTREVETRVMQPQAKEY